MLRLFRTIFVLTNALLGLALLGYVARDRMPALAGLTYLPLLPIALGSLAVAALPGTGRTARIGLALIGSFCSLWALPSSVGWHATTLVAPTGSDARVVRLLQWNVLGAGSMRRSRWPVTIDTIAGESPDIVVLSEAPREGAITELTTRLGPSWSSVQIENRPVSGYWYKLVLASRWPVELVREPPVRRGATMLVQVAAPERPLRVLVVDGESAPTHDRTGMLDDVAAIVRSEAEAGTPIDVLAGDFNAPSRSQGFDLLWSEGYQAAARSSGEWRPTFPVFLPLLDIDHVLVRSALPFDCTFFSSRSSDHRGQLVRLGIRQERSST